MKANEFVKKFGWDVSTKLSREMKGITESVADGVAGWGQSEWDKLKRLVESHELVSNFGGLKRANRILKKAYTSFNTLISVVWNDKPFQCTIQKLEQAIADVESCQ